MKTSNFGQLKLLKDHDERIDLPRKRNKKYKNIFSEIKKLNQK
tara:strand:+ start:353 stop:481 length:129 start_codon:yes stop_codon:yes gene_type:complete